MRDGSGARLLLRIRCIAADLLFPSIDHFIITDNVYFSKSPPSYDVLVGLVSVSDRALRGDYQDKGISALREWLNSALASVGN